MRAFARASWRAAGGAVLLLAVTSGCAPDAGKADTVFTGSTSASNHLPVVRQDNARDTISRTAIIRQAESLYAYGTERPQLRGKDPEFPGPVVGDGRIPRMWIATARFKGSGARPKDRIIARIRSEAPYPQMGIAKGYNYVVRNSWDRQAAHAWRTSVVARDMSIETHDLTRDARKIEFTHGEPLEPRLVVLKVHSVGLGVCLDDPVCGTGHCGYY